MDDDEMRIDYQELDFIDDMLKQVAQDVEQLMEGEAVITSLYRIGDSGVHGTLPLRAMDLRCRDALTGSEIESAINAIWIYDPSRPRINVCKFHDVGYGPHIHIQVHPKTRLA